MGSFSTLWRTTPAILSFPFSAFQPAGAVNLVLELEETGTPTDYLRTMNYKTGEAVIHWTDRRGAGSGAPSYRNLSSVLSSF